MDFSEARDKASEFVKTIESEDGVELKVDQNSHFRLPDAFVFLCNSREYFEGSGRGVVGIGPVRVDSRTGDCRLLEMFESFSLEQDGELIME
ncbi:hypothetical protein ABZY06_28755 [Streptomyces sp. NPDC006540]|uniref:hypothetical protein n=1 Tax=Streptomyces sp. NPDC006540 TaxID=3155353 RepID=UPI0033ADBD5D